MGRISNLEKKRSELIKILKTKEKALKRSTYLNYLDDILFYLPTVNKLDKLKEKLLIVPSNGVKINKPEIIKLIKKNKLQREEEINNIMNMGYNLAKPNKVKNNTPEFKKLGVNTYDKYYTKQFNKLNYYFNEYIYDHEPSLIIVKNGFNVPNINFIRTLVLNKLNNLRQSIDKKLKMHTYFTIKYQLSVEDEDNNKSYYNKYFNTKPVDISSLRQSQDVVFNLIAGFLNNIDKNKQMSGLRFEKIFFVKIKYNLEKSIFGKNYIELPTIIKTKQACVNPKNNDNKCFYWCLIIAKNYNNINGNDKNKVTRYKKFLDTIKEPENFTYPVRLQDIEKFEDLNDIKINVLELNEKYEIYPLYTSQKRNPNVITLMLIHDGDNSHYVWVKETSRLMKSKTSHYKKHICEQCLTASYDCERKLKDHYELCMTHEACKVEMPIANDYTNSEGKLIKANNIMKFKNFNNDFMHPYHIVADFESTLEKFEESESDKTTQRYQKHVANSYGIKYNCIHNQYSEEIKIFNNSDPKKVIESFILELERLAIKSYELSQLNETNIIMNDLQKIEHENNKNCNKCKCLYSNENIKVRHHDHITGDFLSSICNNCNTTMKYKKFIPVYLHNLKGYDSHLFISSLFKYGYNEKGCISCIPNNEEKYISFSKKIKVGECVDNFGIIKNIMFEIRFLDSISFMNESIESLANNLTYHFHNNQKLMNEFTDDEIKNIKTIDNLVRLKNLFPKEKINNDFIDGLLDGYKKGLKNIDQLRNVFKNTSNYFKNDEQFIMMTQKGIYPYDWVDSFNKMNIDKLPNINDFYSKLNNSSCHIEDYKTALIVWEKFECKTFLDYHNIYLVSDVLLLTDIWENFRDVCYKMYNLDCEYYYTAPGLSFDAMLKYTKIELELITDIDKYLFVESGIRGGVSQISTRHAIANNKYMSTYEKTKDESYITYLDANNLYGAGMSTYLPTGDFKWNNQEWNTEKIMNLDNEGDIGYLFEVDLNIPLDKHDYFNDYPLCPENISIKKEYLNKWQQQNYKETDIKKLCLTLINKKKYVINYRYLKLVLSLGYTLEKVHRVLQYKQSDFLKKYIDLNTNARTKATNDFEKSFYKLCNNSIYGKTMQNVRNQIDFRFIETEEEALRCKNVKSWHNFNGDLVGLHIQKMKVTLNKPIYLGQNILDDSKEIMAKFHYNFMMKKINPENIKLLFTDTDSLCYHIKKENIFEIIKENKDEFDLSNYSRNHELYDSTNSKVIGKMKNESPNKQIIEFIGLRSKLYNYKVDDDDDNHVRCKGIKRNVASEININNFKNTLYTRESLSITQNTIKSHKHQLYTETLRKIALSALDDKRYICNDNINTYSFGHKDII